MLDVFHIIACMEKQKIKGGIWLLRAINSLTSVSSVEAILLDEPIFDRSQSNDNSDI